MLAAHWKNLAQHMNYCAGGKRVPEFEVFLLQADDLDLLTAYAADSVKGRWKEAEDLMFSMILKTAEGEEDIDLKNRICKYINRLRSNHKHKTTLDNGIFEWDKMEDQFLLNNPSVRLVWNYFAAAGYKLEKVRWTKAESIIATDGHYSFEYSGIIRERFLAGERAIADTCKDDTTNKGQDRQYLSRFCNDWKEWSEETIAMNPCWCYNYAKNKVRGKLSSYLHNSMIVHAMTAPNNYWIKRYFKAKKYHKIVKHRVPKSNVVVVSPDTSADEAVCSDNGI